MKTIEQWFQSIILSGFDLTESYVKIFGKTIVAQLPQILKSSFL